MDDVMTAPLVAKGPALPDVVMPDASKIPSEQLCQLLLAGGTKAVADASKSSGYSLLKLNLKGCQDITKDLLLEIFAACPNIEVVDLRYTANYWGFAITLEQCLDYLPKTVRCIKTKEIEIDCRNSDVSIAEVWQREKNATADDPLSPEVKSISSNDKRFWRLIEENKLSRGSLNDIRKLNLGRMTDAQLGRIASCKFRCLREVSFYCSNWTIGHVSIVSTWKQLALLKCLTLRFFKVHPSLVTLWSWSKNCPRPHYLKLNDTVYYKREPLYHSFDF